MWPWLRIDIGYCQVCVKKDISQKAKKIIVMFQNTRGLQRPSLGQGVMFVFGIAITYKIGLQVFNLAR